MQRKWSYQKKKSLPLISRNLSIDVQRFKKKKKKYPKYPGHTYSEYVENKLQSHRGAIVFRNPVHQD